MYRGKLWTMRQFSGFGTPEDTNARFHYLLAQGQSGLSVAFHLPTLMGLDSDHPMSEGEVGRCGVAVDSLADMEVLFRGIDLEKTTTSMTINAPAAVVWAMYLVNAEKRGFDLAKVSGTIQNDILKEYIAQKTWIFPPRPSMRLITDTFRYGVESVPRWNTISISGYHIREAGSTAVQELAFTLRNGIEYVEAALQAGLEIDQFAPQTLFLFQRAQRPFRGGRQIPRRPQDLVSCHAGALWSKGPTLVGAALPHTDCRMLADSTAALQQHRANRDSGAGCGSGRNAVTAYQFDGRDIRSAYGAGRGDRAPHPADSGCRIRSVANTVDPLAGSYYVETLTREMEQGCWEYFEKIDAMGGMVRAIEYCFPQREIQDAAYQYQRAVERKEKLIVGVNEFRVEEESGIETLAIDSEVATKQKIRLQEVRASRSAAAVQQALEDLRRAAAGTDNLMPHFINCARQYATLGEMCDVLRSVFGTYTEPIF